jgi:hypothetical protein
MEHHVEHRCGAGAGQPAPISGIELGHGIAGGIGLLEALQIVPVHRHGVTIQQAGGGDDLAARLDRPELSAIADQLPQPCLEPGVLGLLLGFEARQHEDRVVPVVAGGAGVDAHAHTVAGADGGAIARDRLPGVKRRAREPVGDEQRLDCRRQTHIGEGGQEQESDILGLLGRLRHVSTAAPAEFFRDVLT